MAPSLTVNCTLTLPESAIAMILAEMDKDRCTTESTNGMVDRCTTEYKEQCNTVYGTMTSTAEDEVRCTTVDKEQCNTVYGMIASTNYNRKG